MGCSSSCMCIANYKIIRPYPTSQQMVEQNRELVKLVVPQIRVTRPSTFIRRLSPIPPQRDENLLWENWQPKKDRPHDSNQRRFIVKDTGLDYHADENNLNTEHSPYLVTYWATRMTFLDRHREISREMNSWNFLDGKPPVQCDEMEEDKLHMADSQSEVQVEVVSE